MPSVKQIKKQEAVERLRKVIKEGDALTFAITSVAQSGMSRCMKVLAAEIDCYTNKPSIVNITFDVAKACGYTITRNDDFRVAGCGMDMRFHVCDTLRHAMGYTESFRYNSV